MHGACRKMRMHTQLCLENLRGRDHTEDISIDGRIILKWILKKWDVRVWAVVNWPIIGSSCRLL
jgi:hypothetical protein